MNKLHVENKLENQIDVSSYRFFQGKKRYKMQEQRIQTYIYYISIINLMFPISHYDILEKINTKIIE